MAAVDALLATISGKTFVQLTTANQATMAQAFKVVSRAFSESQYALMAPWYLVVPPNRQSELNSLNQGHDCQAQPVTLADGTLVLPISLLTDCATPGTTYEHLKSFLFSLKFRKVQTTDWPTPPPEP